jgi:hypothetical protein
MSDKSLSTETVMEMQRKIRACPQVWLVWVRCDGEQSLEAIYDNREAADLHVKHYNSMKGNAAGYYGKAHVGQSNLLTLEIAQRFTK